jgi:hypothetical protein
MTTMYRELRLNEFVPLTEGDWALEIEAEGRHLPRNENKEFHTLWNVEADGSLRGEDTAEYVMRGPKTMAGLVHSLDVLGYAIESNESFIEESRTAGVHLHMNVQKWHPLKLLTFITTYYILEKMLVRWCGAHRSGNHFCLRATDAELVLHLLQKAVDAKDWRHLNTEDIRYTALNLTAMFKYGSIEFRSMRSTAKLDDILTWAKLIEQVVKGSEQFNTPRDVIQCVSESDGDERFVQAVMGEYAPILGQPDIWEGVRAIQPFVFMAQWDKIGRRKVNPFAQD